MLTAPPIDARAAKRMLRFYAVVLPLGTLIGAWCGLLAATWAVFPAGVDNIPFLVKTAASAIAAFWLFWLCRTFWRLPALIDDILERGLVLDHDQRKNAAPWSGPPDFGD